MPSAKRGNGAGRAMARAFLDLAKELGYRVRAAPRVAHRKRARVPREPDRHPERTRHVPHQTGAMSLLSDMAACLFR